MHNLGSFPRSADPESSLYQETDALSLAAVDRHALQSCRSAVMKRTEGREGNALDPFTSAGTYGLFGNSDNLGLAGINFKHWEVGAKLCIVKSCLFPHTPLTLNQCSPCFFSKVIFYD